MTDKKSKPFTMDDLNRMLTKEHVRYRMRMRYLEQRLRWRLFL